MRGFALPKRKSSTVRGKSYMEQSAILWTNCLLNRIEVKVNGCASYLSTETALSTHPLSFEKTVLTQLMDIEMLFVNFLILIYGCN